MNEPSTAITERQWQQLAALDKWADKSYRRINAALRRPGSRADTQRTRDLIERLTEIGDQFRLAEPVEIWRGVDHAATFRALQSGAGEILDPGFLAGSKHDGPTADFMYRCSRRSERHYPVQLHITLTAGCMYIPVHSLSGMAWGYEHEILTGPSRLQVTSIESEDGEIWAQAIARPLDAQKDIPRWRLAQIDYIASCMTQGEQPRESLLRLMAHPDWSGHRLRAMDEERAALAA